MNKNNNFLIKANLIHNNKYTYLEEYKTSRTPIEIKCNTCNIIFKQTPDNHINKKSGCLICANKRNSLVKRTNINTIKNHDQFTNKLKIKYNNNYLPLEKFINFTKYKLKFNCLIHNNIFYQTPENILTLGPGCSFCISNNRSNKLLENSKINFLKRLDNNKFEYIKDFSGMRNKVWMLCKIHNVCFSTTPEKFFKCPVCEEDKKETILYLLEIYNEYERFYKIGITINTIKERYKSNNIIHNTDYKFKILFEIKKSHSEIKVMEKFYLKEFKNLQYIPKQTFQGYSECFSVNIFNL